MQKFFNTAGPIIPEDHYHIDLLHRLDWEEIQHMIANKQYFVLHAPRQTGKTSTLLAMMKAINSAGDYQALYVNIEAAQALRHDVGEAVRLICEALAASANVYGVKTDLKAINRDLFRDQSPTGALTQLLTHWAQLSEKPVVLMIDEVDALVGDTLISLLRQIRSGYAQRPLAFPQSIILCGIRDVRDYRIHTSDKEIITGGSAFNIKAKSLVMASFSAEEIRSLYQQHTDTTGQVFADSIFPDLWADTRGQPWLVNALGYEMTWEDREARDRSIPITQERYAAARERLIRSRQTHLDQLADKLREPRVSEVIAAILAGEDPIDNIRGDDLQYVEDLGLVTIHPSITISNRIYQEIIPRELTWAWQSGIPNQETNWYVLPDGRLDIPKLLQAFQQFFREHSDSGSDKRKMSSEELRRLFAASQRLFADEEALAGSTVGDINSEAVYDFLNKDNPDILEELKRDTLSAETVFTNLGLLSDGVMTLAGNLLFGKVPSRFTPSFYVDCVHFVGDSVDVDHFVDKSTVKGTLRTQYEGAVQFVRNNLRHVPTEEGFNAQTRPEIDERVMGELLVNALVHREYYIQSSVKVFVFDNRVEIISPGKLPNSLTVEKIKSGLSVHRNPVLNSICKTLLPYSGYGSGIKRVLRLHPDVEFFNDVERELFVCVIPRA